MKLLGFNFLLLRNIYFSGLFGAEQGLEARMWPSFRALFSTTNQRDIPMLKKLAFSLLVVVSVVSSAVYADATISIESSASASSAVLSRSRSHLEAHHIYGIQYPMCCDEYWGDNDIWPTIPPTVDVAPSAVTSCLPEYRADIVFEAEKSRLEGVGADSLFAYLVRLSEEVQQGCPISEIQITAFACIGCDKKKKQPDQVVYDLAEVRANKLLEATHFIIETRQLDALRGVRVSAGTQIVNIPHLGVVGKTAAMVAR